jgi:chorismate lyase / 3-hydroxybenzoate synthase
MNTMASYTAASASTLQLDYMSSAQLATQPAGWWQSVLGVVGFGAAPIIVRAPVPVTASMTPSLGSGDLCEVWRVAGSASDLSNGELRHHSTRYRYCDDLLFGCVLVDEGRLNLGAEQGMGSQAESRALLRATEIAYQEIFDVLGETEHQHLIRIWNYLPDINREVGGDERYRHFNSARQMAFRNSGRATMGTVPAASALGSPSGSPLSIYFLASRQAPRMIENPRQTSAYHYPRKFGRHSPIFSRACVWGESGSSKLFISGTASIVGHETIHRGDVVAQTRETMTNISALLDEANRVVGAARYSLDALKLKVYVRRPADLSAIEATLAQMLHADTSIVFLHADVCREDLLVEIEAVG